MTEDWYVTIMIRGITLDIGYEKGYYFPSVSMMIKGMRWIGLLFIVTF